MWVRVTGETAIGPSSFPVKTKDKPESRHGGHNYYWYPCLWLVHTMTFNSLPGHLDCSNISADTFCRLKTENMGK
jgi:hypothetical protein